MYLSNSVNGVSNWSSSVNQSTRKTQTIRNLNSCLNKPDQSLVHKFSVVTLFNIYKNIAAKCTDGSQIFLKRSGLVLTFRQRTVL